MARAWFALQFKCTKQLQKNGGDYCCCTNHTSWYCVECGQDFWLHLPTSVLAAKTLFLLKKYAPGFGCEKIGITILQFTILWPLLLWEIALDELHITIKQFSNGITSGVLKINCYFYFWSTNTLLKNSKNEGRWGLK